MYLKKKANLKKKPKNRTLYQNDYCKKAIWQQFLFDVIFYKSHIKHFRFSLGWRNCCLIFYVVFKLYV